MACTRIFAFAIAALSVATSDVSLLNEGSLHRTRDYAPLVFFERPAYVARFPATLVATSSVLAALPAKNAPDDDLAAAEAKRQRSRRRHDLGVTC